MRVRLTKKFAERIDGIDLRAHKPGDTLDLSRSDAFNLIAEGWAVRKTQPRRYTSAASQSRAIAADHKKHHG
jgi:hypothetical protein